jgi:hypothetical protein
MTIIVGFMATTVVHQVVILTTMNWKKGAALNRPHAVATMRVVETAR